MVVYLCQYKSPNSSPSPPHSGSVSKHLFSTSTTLFIPLKQVHLYHFSRFHIVVQSPSHVQLFTTPWTAAPKASLSLTISWSLPKFMNQWCYTTSSSSVTFFSFCIQPFPASESFPVSQLFASGGQSIGASASTSVLPINTQDWSPLRWAGWISLQSKDSEESSPTPQFKTINSSVLSLLYCPALTSVHDYWKDSLVCIDLCRQSDVSALSHTD